MKQKIRLNTFETNSSSTHSITIISKEEFEKFKEGKTFMDWGENFYTKEEIKNSEEYKEFDYQDDGDFESKFDAFLWEEEYKGYENFGGEGYETFEEFYTTKSGDEVVAIGYYGYGG